MLRFICKKNRLHFYHYQITGVKTHTKGFPGCKEYIFIQFSGLKAVTNLRLESMKDSGAKRGLIVPPHKLYIQVASVASNVAT